MNDATSAWDAASKEISRLLFRGRPAEALEALREEIAEDPSRAWPYALGAELKRASPFDKFSEALEDLDKAVALEPGRAWIHAYRARALAAAGRSPEALESIDRALALDPGAAWPRAERALILLGLGRAEEALADALECRRLAPTSFRCLWAAANALARAGRWADALAALDRAFALPAAARARSMALSRVEPRALRFEILRALGRLGPARDELRAAVEAGERLGWNADAGAAVRELDAAIAARPRDAWLRFWRGEARLRLGAAAEAEADFTRALALDSRHAWARAWRAWARAARGASAAARQDAGAALKAARSWKAGSPARALLEWQLLALRGDLNLGERLFKPAAADYAAATSLAPFAARPRARRAEALVAMGQIGAAEESLRRALDLDASHRPAYLLRASLRSKRGNLEGALSDLRRAKACEGGDESGGLRFGRPRPGVEPPRGTVGVGRVCVDPRIELVGLLKLAFEPRAVPAFARKKAPEMADYVERAQRRLLPHVGPELVARFRKTAAARGNAGFPWLGITQMMMDASPAPELKPLTAAWRDGEDLCLLRHMRRFVRESRFLEFLDENKALFARWTRPLKATVERENYARTVSIYLGVEIDAYYDFILSPLLRDVSLRAILRGEDGARGARTVHCAFSTEAHLDAVLRPRAEDLLWTGWHEMLHLLIDPWCDLYTEEAREFEHLYAVVPPGVRRKNWMDCFSEHHVRAATQRLLRQRSGPAAQEALEVIDRNEGYRFQGPLAAALDAYERDRARYPTLLDFFPDWIKAWRGLR